MRKRSPTVVSLARSRTKTDPTVHVHKIVVVKKNRRWRTSLVVIFGLRAVTGAAPCLRDGIQRELHRRIRLYPSGSFPVCA